MPLIDLVKFNGKPDVFAWKYPNENLSSYTQLIVSECQEAIVLKDGILLERFGPGHHVVKTYNIPILSRVMGLPFGGKTPFCAEVWFINKRTILDLKWGTMRPLLLQDPKYGVVLQLRSFGQFGVRIEDGWLFLQKLVGSQPIFDRDDLTSYLRGVYTTKVKDAIAAYLLQNGIGALEINAHLGELSQSIQQYLSPILREYGIELVNFCVNDINFVQDNHTLKSLELSLSKRAQQQILGESAQQADQCFCTVCGHKLPDFAVNFCPQCGCDAKKFVRIAEQC